VDWLDWVGGGVGVWCLGSLLGVWVAGSVGGLLLSRVAGDGLGMAFAARLFCLSNLGVL
jgi:hypothetical protein